MAFTGSGGPPPKFAREAGLSKGQKPYGFRFYERLANGKNKIVRFLSLNFDKTTSSGEKNVDVLILDEADPSVGDEWQPSIRIHERFRYNGSWDNYVVCRSETPEGCLLDVALQEAHTHAPWCKVPLDEANPKEGECTRLGKPQNRKGVWRWVATGIKLQPYTVKSGPNAGKVIPYTRCLILAGEEQYKTLLTYRKAWNGLRGRVFSVSRSNSKFSPRIGETWDPKSHMTDEEMLDKFADAAADYGLSVEDYCRPFDYERILTLPTAAEMERIAQWVAGERGVDLGLNQSMSNSGQQTNTDTDLLDEEDVPF